MCPLTISGVMTIDALGWQFGGQTMWLRIVRYWLAFRPMFKLLFFLMLLLALYLGMRPTPTPATYHWQSDLYHAVGLFALTLVSYLAFPRWYWWLRGLLLFGVGVLIEYVQSFHPMRVADWNDLYANGAGIVAGLVLIGGYRYVCRHR